MQSIVSWVGVGVVAIWSLVANAAEAETRPTPFAQTLAAAASADPQLAEWYRKTGYQALWTDADDADRRRALLSAIRAAADHGLPVQRYDAVALEAALKAARTEADRSQVEMAMSRAYLAWARDLTSGALDPAQVDPAIVRDIARIDPQVLLARISAGKPEVVLDWLLPKGQVYLALMKAKIGLEARIAAGGWGPPVAAGELRVGDQGPEVVALRDRLVRMGYLALTAVAVYDAGVEAAVLAFQADHGLPQTGVLDGVTLAELNVPPEERLKSIIVAMERERWLDIDRSVRHIWVNLPDFHAQIYDRGRVVFETRIVIGKAVHDQQSPEFSDVMEHMVINPSWGVPRSIIVKEYLPKLQRNPHAVGHLRIIDGRGRVVSRNAVNFSAYTAATFPFDMMQPPSDDNALGLVKFMFPNPHNIYLHDTPSKSLFGEDVRAFSHGCIRVARPFDLAYELLALQADDPKGLFQQHLDTGKETLVSLDQPVPVHLVYFTAYPNAVGRITYRRDVYGRDALLYQALMQAGVVMDGVQG